MNDEQGKKKCGNLALSTCSCCFSFFQLTVSLRSYWRKDFMACGAEQSNFRTAQSLLWRQSPGKVHLMKLLETK